MENNSEIIKHLSENAKRGCGSCKWSVENEPRYMPSLRRYSHTKCSKYDFEKENECISQKYSLWELNVCLCCIYREATVLNVVWGCAHPFCRGHDNEKRCTGHGCRYFEADKNIVKIQRDIYVTKKG